MQLTSCQMFVFAKCDFHMSHTSEGTGGSRCGFIGLLSLLRFTSADSYGWAVLTVLHLECKKQNKKTHLPNILWQERKIYCSFCNSYSQCLSSFANNCLPREDSIHQIMYMLQPLKWCPCINKPSQLSPISAHHQMQLIASDNPCAVAVCQMSEAEWACQQRCCHVYWTICPYPCPMWYSFQLGSVLQKCPRTHSSVSYIFHTGAGNVNRGVHLEGHTHTHTQWRRKLI